MSQVAAPEQSGAARPSGPLVGVRVLELAGAGPTIFAAMLLSDLGAEVVRVERPGAAISPVLSVMARGRASIELDLKLEADRALLLGAIGKADVLIEGYRPGVMEKLGFGPDGMLAVNPRLIYGRMTGWGQSGPIAQTAGHDINYIALTGALAAMGEPGLPPRPPLNLVGDFGGGALYLAMGVCAALFERARSGKGQVIDAAMIDGAASLMAIFSGFLAVDPQSLARDRLSLGGAAPNYRCYECADGQYIAIGALERQFRDRLYELLEVKREPPFGAIGPADWPAEAAALERIFKTRTRDEWVRLFEGEDVCAAPVLGLAEAPDHPQMVAREVYQTIGGLTQPAPAPRFSRTPGQIQGPAPTAGEGGRERLRAWGAKT